MGVLTRRSVLRSSLGLVAAGGLARPYIANAAATRISMWVVQGFIPEEDAAYKEMVANYQKESGNTVDYSIIPFAPMRQKAVSAVTSGVVPDLMETADFAFLVLNTWNGKLEDVSDIVDPLKAQYSKPALECSYVYNNVTKKRAYHQVPWKLAAVPFHIWTSLVEKSGHKVKDIPKTWDAFWNFFQPVQDALRKKGMRNIFAYGLQLTRTGVDPINTFNAFLIAYGGQNFVTSDGQVHTKDPKVRAAAIKAAATMASFYQNGYVPPVVVNWNDADDNNAFHAKLDVMDFDGTISTEVALYHNKEEYHDILTMGIPLSNEGKPLPAQVGAFGVVIPKGAKNPVAAREFLKYMAEPKVLNDYLKAGLGRWVLPIPKMVKSDPFWLDPKDQHRSTYVRETILGPTIPLYEAYNPGMARVGAENAMMGSVIDVMKNGKKPAEAVDAALKRVDEIIAQYPIAQA
jgi:multiple sugar transport system substrate-binding protein